METTDLAVNWIDLSMVVLFSVVIGFVAALYPESFQGITLAAFWGLVFALALYHIGRRSLREKWLRGVVLAGLLIRVPMVLAHLAVGFLIYTGQLDFPGYFVRAVTGGQRLLAGDLEFFFNLAQPGEVVVSRLLALTYLLIGPSITGIFLLAGLTGFWGSYLFLRAFQTAFPTYREIRFLAVSLFFFPSLAFWTSLLGKDSWLFFFLGLATYAIAHMVKTIRPGHLLGLIVSVASITLIRPPIGLALTAAVGVVAILMVHSVLRTKGPAAILRPMVYIFAIMVLMGTIALTGSSVRRYAKFAESSSLAGDLLTLAITKHVGLSTDPTAGGSSLAVQIRDPSASEVALFLPGAMLSFLFRPFVFEAHNALAFVAALDGTLLILLVLWRWRYLAEAIRSVLSKPFVTFCCTVLLLFTAGLSFESNLGAIVRHRAMVLPFLFILLAVPLRKRDSAGRHVGSDSDLNDLVPTRSAEPER